MSELKITITAYVTKYALSKGIIKVTGVAYGAQTPSLLDCKIDCKTGSYSVFFYGEGSQWHRTWPEALAKAEKMRASALKSLEKKMKKLQSMTFTEPQ